MPQTIANACHVTHIKVPLQSTSNYFFSKLVSTAFCRAILSSSSEVNNNNTYNNNCNDNYYYAESLIKNLIHTRRCESIALGLVSCYTKGMMLLIVGTTTNKLSSFLLRLDLTPKDLATLILTLLQQTLSESTKYGSVDFLQVCTTVFNESSTVHQESIVEQLVFSRNASIVSEGKERCWSQWIVKVMTPITSSSSSSTSLSSLTYHLTNIADRWSQWTFVQEVDGRQQHHVSLVLWQGLIVLTSSTPTTSKNESSSSTLIDLVNHDLVSILMQGVSHRLESTIPTPRQDGMRIAKQLAKGLGQEIHFDELDEDDDKGNTVEDRKGSSTVVEPKVEKKQSTASKSIGHRYLDPDLEYDSDDQDENQERQNYHGEDENGGKKISRR